MGNWPPNARDPRKTHHLGVGYILWIFGFMGAHRFYFGRPVSGTLWFFTLGLLGIGWVIDLFLMPQLNREANAEYRQGPYSYTLAWIALTFLGVFGVHRFYLGRFWTGLLYLVSGGLLGIGVIYDFWNLNEQVHVTNKRLPP